MTQKHPQLAQKWPEITYGKSRLGRSWELFCLLSLFWGCPRVILPRIFTPGPSTTLRQPPRRYPTHPGPILTSQLLLEGDLGPKTCHWAHMGYFSLSLLEMSQSDSTAYFHPRTQYNPPTTSGEVSNPPRTNSDHTTPSRRWFRSGNVPESAFPRHSGTPQKNVSVIALGIYPRSLHNEYLRLPHGSEVPKWQHVCWSEEEKVQKPCLGTSLAKYWSNS